MKDVADLGQNKKIMTSFYHRALSIGSSDWFFLSENKAVYA